MNVLLHLLSFDQQVSPACFWTLRNSDAIGSIDSTLHRGLFFPSLAETKDIHLSTWIFLWFTGVRVNFSKQSSCFAECVFALMPAHRRASCCRFWKIIIHDFSGCFPLTPSYEYMEGVVWIILWYFLQLEGGHYINKLKHDTFKFLILSCEKKEGQTTLQQHQGE